MRMRKSLRLSILVMAWLTWRGGLGAWALERGATPVGDLARLQGRWVTRAGERREIVVELTITGDEVQTTITTPQGLKLEASGTVRLDERSSPRSLDWVHFRGADSIDLPDIPAIYEFVDGGVRVCNGGPNNRRPRAFRPGSGVLADVHLFERPPAPLVAGRPIDTPRR